MAKRKQIAETLHCTRQEKVDVLFEYLLLSYQMHDPPHKHNSPLSPPYAAIDKEEGAVPCLCYKIQFSNK